MTSFTRNGTPMNGSLANRFRIRLLTALVVASGLMIASATTEVLVAETLVIAGGTVHPVSSEPFVGHVVIEDGRITAVGADIDVPSGAQRIDASGLDVYPGFFDALSQIGLIEINAVPATVDASELGTFNPHLVAATAIHPASDVIPVTREVGITQTLVAPQSGRDGIIAGRASAVHLDGWTVEEMTIEADVAMIVAWPEIRTRSFDFATFSVRETPFNEAKDEAEAQQNRLRDWIDAGRHYSRAQDAGSDRLTRNLELEALGPMLAGEQPVVIHADAKRDIESAIDFAEAEGLDIILAGGRDAWMVAETLAEKEIPVILGSVQSNPNEEDDPFDRPYRNAGTLAEAGVSIAFASGAGGGFGPGGPHASRNLVFEAGMATAYGLSTEDAIEALTINPARMLGLDDRLGTIEAGKIANLVISDGDPLEYLSTIRHVIISGRDVDLDNKHESLYQRYRSRPLPDAE